MSLFNIFKKSPPKQSRASSNDLNQTDFNNNSLPRQASSTGSANVCCNTDKAETYSLAEEIVKGKIAGDNLEDLKVLQGLRPDEVIVVSGSADKIETVFTNIHLPHTLITPEQLGSYKLKPEHTLYINCHPTGYTPQAMENVKKFVASGGLLFTTDYVLNTMLTHLFPNILHYGGENTSDMSVPIECSDDPYDEILKAFKGETEWKLAGSSHPITIRDSSQVTVLINSNALAKQYNGNGAVLIRFQYLQGTIYHMISHFNLQHGQSSAPSVNSSITATDYARSKGASDDVCNKMEAMEKDNRINYTEVQSASLTTEVAYRAAMGQKKKFTK